ncbi:MAG TPA: lytic transglycosylase domain-containing protein [Alphaproteobacteria bacterium]|nr:lytic transglycosylase domain-containing protein [Alphaproteobacteria bacterium]
MNTLQVFATCLMMAANTYNVPPQIMVGILHVEGGHIGQEAGPNVNGTYDLGPMQVNSNWVPKLSQYWKVDQRTARQWVRDDGCVNLHVAAWILRQKLDQAGGNLFGGIARYHSATSPLGERYASKVIKAMDRVGLIDYGNGKGGKPPAKATKKPLRVAEK